jgi:hypothetical protein
LLLEGKISAKTKRLETRGEEDEDQNEGNNLQAPVLQQAIAVTMATEEATPAWETGRTPDRDPITTMPAAVLVAKERKIAPIR